jgi:predicted SAM-dependent methyltransferase
MYKNKKDGYKLNVGCGNVIFKDWINIDLEPTNSLVDLACDVRQGLPFEDNSCSLIYNEHFLEHLTVEEGLFFLKECRRVLQPGGVIRISMPSLDVCIEKYNSADWRDGQDWLTWPEYQFIQTRAEMINIAFRWWEHKWLYDREELNRRLLESGYTNIREVSHSKSSIAEFNNRETRKDSLLNFEAEVPDTLKQDLRLRDVNLMIFPDWSQSEELVGLELKQVIKTLVNELGNQGTTLLIDTTNIAIEDAEMFLSSVTMNLMMEEDIDITEELEISLIEDLSDIQWATLLPSINARIVLECDNQAAIGNLALTELSQLDLKAFMRSNQALVSN